MKIRRTILTAIAALALLFVSPEKAQAQFYAVYGNGLLLPTATINLGANIGLSNHISLDFAVMGNPLQTADFKTKFLMVQPGVRWWMTEIQYGNFLGAHLFAGVYDVGNREFYTKGFTVGVGISWGYNWLITKRFNIGVEIGAGIGFMQDTREYYDVPLSEDYYIYNATRWAILPTKLAVNFVYLF